MCVCVCEVAQDSGGGELCVFLGRLPLFLLWAPHHLCRTHFLVPFISYTQTSLATRHIAVAEAAHPFQLAPPAKDIDSTHALSKLHFILTTFMIVFVTAAINHSTAVWRWRRYQLWKMRPIYHAKNSEEGSKSHPDEPPRAFFQVPQIWNRKHTRASPPRERLSEHVFMLPESDSIATFFAQWDNDMLGVLSFIFAKKSFRSFILSEEKIWKNGKKAMSK
jgi:hypothetical protein